MSVIIVGGNERMERQYKDLCQQYRCHAKVYTKESGMSGKVGEPDLLVLFTGTMSHKMLQGALCAVKGKSTAIARSHSSSIAALRGILETHAAAAVAEVFGVGDFSANQVSDYDALAWGCSAQGDEVLEEYEFEPKSDECASAMLRCRP